MNVACPLATFTGSMRPWLHRIKFLRQATTIFWMRPIHGIPVSWNFVPPLTTSNETFVDSQPHKVFLICMAFVSLKTLSWLHVPQLQLTVCGTVETHHPCRSKPKLNVANNLCSAITGFIIWLTKPWTDNPRMLRSDWIHFVFLNWIFLPYRFSISRDRNGHSWFGGVIVTKDGTGCC